LTVGRQFGVLRIAGIDADWSLPRRDSKGRKPFVEVDPYMGIDAACRRRDLTMNAMAIDLYELCHKIAEKGIIISPIKDFCIIDPYGGLKDMAVRQLQVVDENLFLEDPLRLYRVMQFIGRFELLPTQQLSLLCSSMKLYDEHTNKKIAKERIFEEIKKLFLKSNQPSLGFRWLRDIGRLNETFPELYSLIDVSQRSDYHPEGDVFEHTMQALDAAAQQNIYQASEKQTTEDEKFLIMLAVLAHDLGKTITTDTQLHCHGHEEAGVGLGEQLLRRITDNQVLVSSVKKLVRYHCMPFYLTNKDVDIGAYKKLARKLSPEVNLRHIWLVGLADILGRNAVGLQPLSRPIHEEHSKRMNQFIAMAEEAGVIYEQEKPILLGRHLLDVVPPGAGLGKLLDCAYQLQIEENIKDWQVLRQRVLKDSKKQ
jgi:tRNA nucleotidyltransferase (CCA-adding enzyme)